MSTVKILIVSPDISEYTGGGLVGQTIINSLIEAANSLAFKTITYRIAPYKDYKSKIVNQLRGYACGLNAHVMKELIEIISNESIDIVFYNSSRYGVLLEAIKKIYPRLKHIVLSHNVEVRFFLEAFKEKYNLKCLLPLWSSWVNESKTVKLADILISLNERDSLEQERIYHRKADYICPLSLKDRFNKLNGKTPSNLIGGFIGSNFFANKHGMMWFAENVSPYINVPILLIGKDFEKEKDYFSKFKNIQLIGTVDNLDEYYNKISFIISPIFYGSGMKTKTAEAMMFAKTIFGTTEAFEGYEVDYEKIGGLCNSAQDFISKINQFDLSQYYNDYSRSVYEEKYSDLNNLKLFKRILTSI